MSKILYTYSLGFTELNRDYLYRLIDSLFSIYRIRDDNNGEEKGHKEFLETSFLSPAFETLLFLRNLCSTTITFSRYNTNILKGTVLEDISSNYSVILSLNSFVEYLYIRFIVWAKTPALIGNAENQERLKQINDANEKVSSFLAEGGLHLLLPDFKSCSEDSSEFPVRIDFVNEPAPRNKRYHVESINLYDKNVLINSITKEDLTQDNPLLELFKETFHERLYKFNSASYPAELLCIPYIESINRAEMFYQLYQLNLAKGAIKRDMEVGDTSTTSNISGKKREFGQTCMKCTKAI